MINLDNFTIKSSLHDLPILASVSYLKKDIPKPVIIFSHGFKGFKDWGHFPLVARWFAAQGFAFVRFNFSHNGTTPEEPADFANLDNFGKNNFSIELHDLDDVINWVEANSDEHQFDKEKIYLIGHSRGGGISIIKASEDVRIKKIVTWASVADFESRMKVDGFEEWKKTGVTYIPNARTNQNMPLYFQFYEDLDRNRERLLIKKAAKKLNKPFLIVHGTEDDTVSINEANALHQWVAGSRLCLIENADHAFNATHPFTAQELNEHILKKLKVSLEFLVGNNIV
jgi:pimeloyl-ACP methyl ester carboxylesterase